MKTTAQIGMWKAIAFLTIISCLFSCSSCDPEVEIKPQVTIGVAENITDSSATLVAYVTPNGEIEVFFSYQVDNSTWSTTKLVTKFNGNTAVKVTFDLKDLRPGTVYNFKVEANNKTGLTTSDISSFITIALVKSVVVISPATDVKITTAKVNAVIIPNHESTVSFEYQIPGSNWKTQVLPTTFSGSTAINVSFELRDLLSNTKYNFRVKIINKAGESVSETATFETYAVTDFDGNYYHTVTIGTQTWLRENFKGTHFSNGDPIPNITDQTQWEAATSPAYCYYDNDIKNADTYGALYNWYVASDSRGLISGYHVSTEPEWRSLVTYLGGSSVAGGKLKESGFSHWKNPNSGANNSTNFTALPGGIRTYHFTNNQETAYFWSSSVYLVTSAAYVFAVGFNYQNVDSGGQNFNRGVSIRLVKN